MVTLVTAYDGGRPRPGKQERYLYTLYPGNAFALPCDTGNATKPVCSRVALCATVPESDKSQAPHTRGGQ